MRNHFLSFLLILATSCPLFGQADVNESTLAQALSKLDLGVELLEAQSPAAKQTIREAAADIQQVIDDQNLESAGAYQALGNAYMLTQDYGLAVLAYRRGEQINPTDPRLSDSLEYAREQVAIKVTPNTSNRIVGLLMSWRGIIPRQAIWATFVSLFTISWLMLMAQSAFGAPRWFIAAGIWSLALSLVPVTALLAEWKLYQDRDDVVLLQSDTIARSGPDDSIYDPVYSEPLDAGTEATLLEQRDQWSRLTLADGTECWVRTETYARVNP